MTVPHPAHRPRLAPLVEPGPALSRQEVERWARHVLLPELGLEGQRRLRNARVAVIGAGGLGCPLMQYLVAAGVGHLTVFDDDVVETSNLQRQVLHGPDDVGRPKVESAVESLSRLGGATTLSAVQERLGPETAVDLLAGHDLVVDGTDNFPTRYTLDAACRELGVPHVWAALMATRAQVSTFWAAPRPADPDEGGAASVPGVTLRDVFPVAPDPTSVPACGDAGVLGALCGLVGSVMALEVVKLVTGTGEPLLGRVLFVDAATMRTQEIPVAALPGGVGKDDAPTGGSPVEEPGTGSPTPDAAPEPDWPLVTASELASRLGAEDAPLVVDVRSAGELAFGQVPGSVHLALTELADEPGPAVERLRAAGAGQRPVVLVCKAGVRARAAARHLAVHGMDAPAVLEGGMIAWSRDVDPDLPRY
ncbi:ThiF family adenylyltransferase [Kytococcus sp. Marseille-QA3725]